MRHAIEGHATSREHGDRAPRWRAVALATLAAATLAGTACGRGATEPDLPSPIAAVAHHGENVYDAARATDWPRAASSLDSLQRGATGIGAVEGVHDTLRTQLVAQLDTLSSAVTTRDRFGSLRSANELTRLAAEATRPFSPSLPVEVTLLDYDGRLLELWSEQNDPGKLRSSTALMRRTWDAVRGRVESRPGGQGAAASFDALVMRAEAATTVADYAAVAPRILDEVDALERLFPAPEKPD